MCLYAGGNKIEIAKKPITVWKCVMKDRTPNIYGGVRYKRGSIVWAHRRGKKLAVLKIRARRVNAAIHSYATREVAFWLNVSNGMIIKCVIPKGTQYVHSASGRQYASLKVKVLT